MLLCSLCVNVLQMSLLCISDFSDSDDDYSDKDMMVRSPPKKTKKNNVGPRYTPDSVDDLSDENNAILTPVIRTSNATTMQSAVPLNQRVNFAGEVRGLFYT